VITCFKRKFYCFFFILLFSNYSFAFVQEHLDTIIHKSYEDLMLLYDQSDKLEEEAFYGSIFLKKAKTEKNKQFIIAGYRMLSLTYKDERVLKYCDSIIALTALNSDRYYPGIVYEVKGDYYYNKRVHKRALDNYLEFLNYAIKHNNKQSISRANYNIGSLKRRIGDIEGALKLFKKNFDFTVNNKDTICHDKTYLNSISALAGLFNYTEFIDSASYYNKYGINESLRLGNNFYYNHFSLNQGVTSYYRKDYNTAIDQLEKHIPYTKEIGNLIDLPFVYYYVGEAHLAMDNEEKAMDYFKKVDSIFRETQSLYPIIRKTYVRLDNYYKDRGDHKNRAEFLDQLIKVDSILKSEELYLNKKIIKEYDIPKIRAEKENVVREITLQKNWLRNIVISLVIFSVFLIIALRSQFQKRKIYKQRFQEIINNNKIISPQNDNVINKKTLGIPKNVVEDILIGLEQFERNKDFVSNEITLNFLARKLNTNPNYLSRVINCHKKSSFTNYVNKLRINFCVKQLRENPTYLKYTIKAISREVGFNNVQSFAKAFYNSKGINPSYFIKELKKVKL